jgi:hypothetical protein
MSATCPSCFRADDVTQVRGFEGLWTFTCANDKGHDPVGPYAWEGSNDPDGTGDDVRRSLAPLFGPLQSCVVAGEPFVEYGVVEWRFQRVAPALFKELVDEHGHRTLNSKETKKTTSAYLAQALGLLAADGELVAVDGKATGVWSYNGQVRYWAVAPAPPTTTRLSWADFAEKNGLDPNDLAAAYGKPA